MNSSLYIGSVWHHRLTPKEHSFRYPLFMLWVDLDELPSLSKSIVGFSYNRRHLFTLNDADYLAGPGSIKEKICSHLLEHGYGDANRVWLLTLPRMAGYVFNPVSFFYIYDSRGVLMARVAEVGNTFGERKIFILPPEGAISMVKNFYVSPFSQLDDCFLFDLQDPGIELDLVIKTLRKDKPIVFSRLSGCRVPLERFSLLKQFARLPFLTMRIILSIHWQAFLLWKKRVPHSRKSDGLDQQVDVLRPHFSLNNPPKRL